MVHFKLLLMVTFHIILLFYRCISVYLTKTLFNLPGEEGHGAGQTRGESSTETGVWGQQNGETVGNGKTTRQQRERKALRWQKKSYA